MIIACVDIHRVSVPVPRAVPTPLPPLPICRPSAALAVGRARLALSPQPGPCSVTVPMGRPSVMPP